MMPHSAPSGAITGYECLAGGGEMGAYMRSYDWSKTLLGPVGAWPQSLRTSVSTCLNSRFPILIWWGRDLVMLYNDAYRDVIAAKHPAALGHPGRDCWPEIWHIIGPMLEGVFERGEATWSNDLLLLLERNGYAEECYFTFSYSPIRDESGGIGGVFTPVAETTEHVIGERRLRTMRDLASRTRGARDVGTACRAVAATIAENPYSIPFMALYLFEQDGSARIAGKAGIPEDSTIVPEILRLDDLPPVIAQAARKTEMTVINDLSRLLGPLPLGAWDTPAHSGVVLPVITSGQASPLGFVLAGANPRKRLEGGFRTFFELLGAQISSAISDARAYEEERRRAQALAEIDRAKTVFFSNVSHEFRTPLTLMLGPLEAMIQRAAPTTQIDREELQLVHRNAMRLMKLVNTLLDFSRIEAGRIQARYESTDLAAFTAEIASAFRSAMDSAGLEFVIDCPPLPEQVFVDQDMWEKIVLNLISNAFKFTLAGSIAVRVKDGGHRVELTVEDTGVGIPENEVLQIFDRFHRVDGAAGRTHEGSGIGLALVQELVKLHDGVVHVESSLGRGSTFFVSVPKGRAHLPPDRIAPVRVVGSRGVTTSAYVEEALQWLPDSERPRQPAPLFAADTVQAPHTQTATGRILLADDNADMRRYVNRLLGDYYEVEAVSNGAQALEAIHRKMPDLVLSDVMMPGIDGFDLLRRLRADKSTSTIPIILLSARAGEDARVEGLSAGADDYMVKPFTARELLARVGAHLSMSQLRSQAAQRERALRAEAQAAQERTVTLLESISDSFLALDADWRYTYFNAAAERTSARSRADLIGKVIWEAFPEILGTELEGSLRQAMTERVPTHVDNHFDTVQRWFQIRIYPAKDGGLSIFYQDITDRKQQEEIIRMANDALRGANAELEQFAYSASHDLREPLRMVRIYTELLRLNYAGKLDSRADQMIGYCVESAGRMNTLIDNLLVYVRASTEKNEPAIAVSLESALGTAILNLRAAIEETGATVSFDPMPALRVAETHAQQLFQNLLGNALKYRRDEPPKVHVGARRQNGDWIFSVQDNGIGIAPEFRDRVFSPFKRLHAPSEYSGSGLGLAICKRLVERYGGRIWVESEQGSGSTFFFSIPDRDSL